MSETNETKKKSGGPAILLFLLAIGGLWLWKKSKGKAADEATDDTISDYGGGGGGSSEGLIDIDPVYDVIEDVTIVDNTDTLAEQKAAEAARIAAAKAARYQAPSGSTGNGGSTTIKQTMTARTLDPEWQAQKARINMALVPDYQKRQIEKGAVTKNTLKSIADYQQVKAGTMSAFDYANDPNMPEEMRAGIEYSSTAYQGSATTVRNRALSYYARQTGAHRGSMSAAERAAWDAANENAALTAYANAAGSGLQADTARELASKTTSNKTATVKTTTNKTTTLKGTSGLGLGASRGSAQSREQQIITRNVVHRLTLKAAKGSIATAVRDAAVINTMFKLPVPSGVPAEPAMNVISSSASKGSSQPGKGGTTKKTSSGKTSAKGTSALGKGASAGKTSAKK